MGVLFLENLLEVAFLLLAATHFFSQRFLQSGQSLLQSLNLLELMPQLQPDLHHAGAGRRPPLTDCLALGQIGIFPSE